MKQEDAAALYEIYERALKVLSEAEPVLLNLAQGKERMDASQGYLKVIDSILGMREPWVAQHPAIDTAIREQYAPSTMLDPDEQQAADRLTPEQIQRIDMELLADCMPVWRKSARIVGTAMLALSEELPGVPDGYYAQRVIALVEAGKLESQGKLHYMRFSEVRLAEPPSNA